MATSKTSKAIPKLLHKNYSKSLKISNYFGQTLKELRLQKNLTQGKAAKILEISQAQWSGYEKGTSRPTLDTIINIADKFEIEPLVLIGKSLDKFKFSADPDKELTFIEYDKINRDVIENYRSKRMQIGLQSV